MRQHLAYTICLCLSLLIGSAPLAYAENQPAHADQAPPKDLHIYILIGQSNMAGRAPITEDIAGVIDRCYLLDDKNQWVPAKNPLNLYSTIRKAEGMQKLGPGYGFAVQMLKDNPDLKLGLIVNARGGSKIESWVGDKPEYYQALIKRVKALDDAGTIKGVLWHQGESNSDKPEQYLGQLTTLITNLRKDLGDEKLPFVAGQITNTPAMAINDQIAKLPSVVHATAVASSEGLKTQDRWHFDTESQLKLGERYAEQMIRLHKQAEEEGKPQPPKDIQFIDVHVHAHAVNEGGLDLVAKWMARNNIDRCIVSPLDHKGSRAYTEDERKQMLAHYAKYKGRIERMCLIEPGDFDSVDAAVAQLKQEIKDGAIAMGEHYGKGLMFDDPKNLLIYEACEKADLPVMFHIDQNKNMVEPGMQRVDNVLKKYPDCKLIAHAYWWRQLKDADRQLQQYPNLYADLSGHVVPQVLERDRAFARAFCIRNQDKLLFGTDEGWWSFKDEPTKYKHYTFFESLDLPDDVRYKIYRGNAEKLFGWDDDNLPDNHEDKPACDEPGAVDTVNVNTREALIDAVKNAKPGTAIVLAPGEYKGGLHFTNIHGEEGKPITIIGGKGDFFPTIRGGTNCIQISDASYLVLEKLQLREATGNNLNIDDAGNIDKPSHHITLRELIVKDVKGTGNNDGIKLSGITDFTIERCNVHNWGKGGSAIDMVGCHRGVIRDGRISRNNQDGASGIQCKGGTSEIDIFNCQFINAGARHINVGGSTGRAFFRPKLAEKDNAEARDIEVAGCIFRGSGTPIAFVGVDAANVHHNTLYHPDPWVFRILQESADEDFIPCRDVVFTDNLIVFKQADLRTTVNIGPNTKPESFTFARNWWYCEDAPNKSTPTLPTRETDGVYGTDPLIKDNGSIERDTPAKRVGAHAWLSEKKRHD